MSLTLSYTEHPIHLGSTLRSATGTRAASSETASRDLAGAESSWNSNPSIQSSGLRNGCARRSLRNPRRPLHSGGRWYGQQSQTARRTS